jgi:hypothetical protein
VEVQSNRKEHLVSESLIDVARSERFGEQIPVGSERLRMRREGIEHIDVCGKLKVPVASSLDRAPMREGWEPYWVTINLKERPQKWVTYRRVTA